MTSRRPDLSVVVVTHNGREVALETLRSARAAAGTIDVEWLLVDSGSSDGVADAVEARWPDIKVVRRANVGFAAANNVALPLARGRYVLLLNPDVEVVRGSLEQLVEALDARPEVGVAGVLQTDAAGATLLTVRRDPSPLRKLGEALFAARMAPLRRLQERMTEADGYERERPADWLVGSFLAVRREALEAVGGLDERFFLYSEEVDWCYRIRQAGWGVRHVPVMTIVHHCGSTDDPRLTAQMNWSRLLFAHKHFSPPRRAAFRAALVTGHLIRLALLPLAAPVRPRARTRLRGERWALRVALGRSAPPLG